MNPLPLSDWDDSLQNIVDDMHGAPIAVHALMANHPRLLQAWWDLRMYLVNGGDLEQRHCELVILRIAARLRNWYEWGSHVVRGLQSGLSLQEIDNVLVENAAWGDADAALLAAVDELTEHNALCPATLEHLSSWFSDRQVMDIMLLNGMYRTLGCLIESWGLKLDENVVNQLPDGVSESTFRETVT